MGYVRYVFLILILGGSTSIGFLLAGSYNDRVKDLKTLSNLINILQNKIKFTHKPLAEILEEISIIERPNKLAVIFEKASIKLKNKRVEDAWNEAISEQKFYLNFRKEDIELIKTLGNVLGKTDIDGQMSEINQFSILLESQIKNAEEEKNKNAKMYKSLGTIIGLAIVIILF